MGMKLSRVSRQVFENIWFLGKKAKGTSLCMYKKLG